MALLVTELSSNLLKHAGRGELHLRVLPRQGDAGIELLAVDRAKGFDLEACMADGFSTGGTQGIGLGAVSRQADVFDVYADHRGAVLLARLYRATTVSRTCLTASVSTRCMTTRPAAMSGIWRIAAQTSAR